MMLAATTTSTTLRRQLLLLSSSRSIPTAAAAAAAAAVTNNQYRRSIHIEKKLTTLGIELPPAPMPKANYNIMCIPPGENVMYLSGHLPIKADGSFITGAVGPETGGLTIEEGKAAARQCALNLVATLKNQLGDLDRVEQIIKVFGIVNSHVEFKHQPAVMDGCSDLLMDIFDKPVGYHARSAIGTNTLPFDVSVEIEMIVKFKPDVDDEDDDEDE